MNQLGITVACLIPQHLFYVQQLFEPEKPSEIYLKFVRKSPQKLVQLIFFKQ